MIVSDSVNRGNCLWCQHDRWKNTICWFHLWVESFVRSAEAPCTHLQGKQFSCRVLVCTSSSIYTQRSAVWQCTTFMLESVSREDWLNLFYFPRPSFCPFCLLHLFSCFVSPAQLWLTVYFSTNLCSLWGTSHAVLHSLTYNFRFVRPQACPAMLVSLFRSFLCHFVCVCMREIEIGGQLLGSVLWIWDSSLLSIQLSC